MVSKNTSLRILSAVILIIVLLACIFYGQLATHGFVIVAGSLIVYEIFTNFLKRPPFGVLSIISIFIFAFLYWFTNISNSSLQFQHSILIIALFVDAIFVFYLFFTQMESNSFKITWERLPILLPLKLSIFLVCVGMLIQLPNWKALIGLVLFVNFGMDTGAWLIGKNFGKHKLWKSVSPSKTMEGLFGGIFFSALLGSLYSYFMINSFSWVLPLIFGGLGVFSQVGDLVQSKIKRQFAIKDSSALIPGHGGVYDRVDSLMFVAPMFLVLFKYFYFE